MRIGLLFFAFLFFASCAGSETRLSAEQDLLPRYDVRKIKLKNGLTVLFLEDKDVPIVSYTTWVKVGSAFEKRGKTGIAHLFEHLMFKGTEKFGPKEFFKRIESNGGVVNAFTQREMTVFYEVVARESLDLVIEMEADRLKNFRLTKADLENEKKVVHDERRLRVDSNFEAQQAQKLWKEVFGDNGLGWPVIGFKNDLDSITVDDCNSFFNEYYQPQNILITVSGDFDSKKILATIRENYESIPSRNVVRPSFSEIKTPLAEKRLFLKRPVKSDTLMVAYPIPASSDRDVDRLNVLSSAVFELASSRARKVLYREKQLVTDIDADVHESAFRSLFTISLELRKGVARHAVEDELDRLIERLKSDVLSDEELSRVKNRLIYSVVSSAKSPYGVSSWFGASEAYFEDYSRVYQTIRFLQGISSHDLRDVARRYLSKNNRVVLWMGKGA